MKTGDTIDLQRTRRRRMRRAFSLMELTLVLLIMGILATVAVVAIGGRADSAKVTATETTLRAVKRDLDAYQAANSNYPSTLDAIKAGFDNKLQDGWKREFYYRPADLGANPPYYLSSAGPDGKHNTGDDINVWTMDDDGQG